MYPQLFIAAASARLADFYIRVGQTFDQLSFDPNTYTQCVYQSTALMDGETRMFTCDSPIEGRFVTVHFPMTRTEVLTLCEVAVYEMNQGIFMLTSILKQFSACNVNSNFERIIA